MPARVTTVPRSIGPTLPGITIARPTSPPSAGPVRNTVPSSVAGAAPLPTVAATDPTRESAGQAPLGTCASGQIPTPAMPPARPGGKSVTTRPIPSSPSGRESRSVTAPAGLPAARSATSTASAGRNASGPHAPPAPSASVVKAAVRSTAAPPLHGVSRAVIVCSPQPGGLASTAFGPPWNVSVNDVNGTCGRSSNTVVICPVAGSSRTSPPSLSRTPAWSTATNSPSGRAGVAAANDTVPVRGAGRSGVANVTEPIRAVAGHCDGPSSPSPNCASVHASRPSATPGESVVPAGRTTSARRTCAWRTGSSAPGTVSVTL